VVAVKPTSRNVPIFAEALETAHPPGYIALDKENLSAQWLRVPEREQVPVACEVQLVIEYYSR
jgi:small subunit ribosomal protein S4